MIAKYEKSKSSDGDKICAIVDTMKLYISAREKNLALDFNVKLKNKEKYKEALEKNGMLFSSQTEGYGKQPPENKFLYIQDDSKHKTAFASKVLKDADIRLTANGGRIDRETVYHAFTNEVEKPIYKYGTTNKGEVSYPFTTMSYYSSQSSSEVLR